ncbi:MAG: neutral/alkaline non-lysosomal ceramidase N-terminal domain-containing protein [Ignavibacteriaceae bacterium]
MGGNIGIHDNLYAKSITFDDGVNKGAIVACDLIGLDYEIISFVRNEVGKRIGVNPESIMIASSHTHSGPATIQSNGIGLKNENYINYLKEKFIGSLTKAFASLKPAESYYYQGTCDIGINRGGKIPKGSIDPLPDPDGFVDKQVSVIAFYRSGTNKPISILFNYGCHPTVLGPENNFVSSDFQGARAAL